MNSGEYDKIPVFWHVMATKSTYISISSGVLKLPLSKSGEKDLCCVVRKHPSQCREMKIQSRYGFDLNPFFVYKFIGKVGHWSCLRVDYCSRHY